MVFYRGDLNINIEKLFKIFYFFLKLLASAKICSLKKLDVSILSMSVKKVLYFLQPLVCSENVRAALPLLIFLRVRLVMSFEARSYSLSSVFEALWGLHSTEKCLTRIEKSCSKIFQSSI